MRVGNWILDPASQIKPPLPREMVDIIRQQIVFFQSVRNAFSDPPAELDAPKGTPNVHKYLTTSQAFIEKCQEFEASAVEVAKAGDDLSKIAKAEELSEGVDNAKKWVKQVQSWTELPPPTKDLFKDLRAGLLRVSR